MSPLVVIVILGAGVAILGICLFRERRYLKTLMSIKEMLADELEKCRETKELYLTRKEKGIMIMALTAPQVKTRMSEPKTKHIDRKAYKALLEKMKESIEQ